MLTKSRTKFHLYVNDIGHRIIQVISIFFIPLATLQTLLKWISSFATKKPPPPTASTTTVTNETDPSTTNHKSKTQCIKCKFTQIVRTVYVDIQLIPDRAYYLVHRYLIHSPICVLNKIGYKKVLYVRDGIYLTSTQGYNDYLIARALKEAKEQVLPIAVDVSIPSKEIEAASKLEPVTSQENTTERSQNQEVQPALEPDPIVQIEAPNGVTKSKFSFLIPANSRKVVLKLTGNKTRRTPTVINSISPNDDEYISNVAAAIRNVFPLESYDDGSLAPIILRLAWHCCATYDKHTGLGGSNGATMRFIPEITDEGNTGLDIARSALEPIKQKFPKITYSDLWTLAGKLAIEEMEGPTTIVWKPGRVDCKDAEFVPPNGYLPFADKDANHIRTTFERLGMDDRQTVALLGAHGMGRCHKRFSGWEGKWTQHPITFSNEFFIVLLNENWTLDTVPETGRQQFYNQDRSLIMLNTDMELLHDEGFLYWVKKYAEDQDLYFREFSESFSKLLELGIERDRNGAVLPKKKY